MAKPTLQEINEAISTLASAGMLLNSEQTIAINRVRSEIKQQSEEYARAAEAKHQQEQEAQRRAEEARRLSKERKLANSHTDEQNELQEYETIPVDGLWQIFKQPWLHKAFKDRMCQCGMQESILSPQITHMQYKIKKIESNKSYNSLVNNCSTISDLRKLINTFLREWGDERRFVWRKQLFNDYIDFLVLVIFSPDATANKPIKQKKHSDQPIRSNEHRIRSNEQKIKVIYNNGTTHSYEPFAVLCYIIKLVGTRVVINLNLHVGSGLTRLLRIGEPANNVNYRNLENDYWIKSNCTPKETLDIIRQIIMKSGTSKILNVQLVDHA